MSDGCTTGTLNATVTGNTIASGDPANTTHGVIFQSGTSSSNNTKICLDLGGAGALANNIQGTESTGGADVRVFQRFTNTIFQLPRLHRGRHRRDRDSRCHQLPARPQHHHHRQRRARRASTWLPEHTGRRCLPAALRGDHVG